MTRRPRGENRPPRAPAIVRRPDWTLPEAAVVPEAVYWRRREVLRALGLGGLAVAAGGVSGTAVPGLAHAQGSGPGSAPPIAPHPAAPADVRARYPAPRDPAFRVVGGRSIVPEARAGGYNNYYELTTNKRRVWRLAQDFSSRPWTIEVAGLVDRPGTYDVDALQKRLDLEERVYRFRCVEAWSMVVPWTGFSLARLLDEVGVRSGARYVRFVSFERPAQAPGQRTQTWYPWPYHEGLRIDEARHDLTLLATGIFGHPLPNQHGAPVRLVVPWKYGYKSAKGIVRIELVRDRPPTFWNRLAPGEYGFESNVDPAVPHPRWSQATERDLATGDRIPTLKHNGYGAMVADLYRRAAPAEPTRRE